jgi:hypothetical protein
MSSVNFSVKIGNINSDAKGLTTFKIDAEMHKDKVIFLISRFKLLARKCNKNYRETNFQIYSLNCPHRL